MIRSVHYPTDGQVRSDLKPEEIGAALQQPGGLLYKVADELVADYMPAVEAMDEAIDQVEDEVFGQPGPDLL